MTSRRAFVEQLANLEFTHATPAVTGHLLALFSDGDIDWQALARPVASILLRRDDDALLHAYLRRCVNTSYALEQRFSAMRRDALLKKDPSDLDLLVSLAVQCFLNGWIWAESAEEARAVESLGDSGRERVLRAAYRPLTSADFLKDEPACADLLRIALDEPSAEARLAAALPDERPYDDVTAAVRAQYEQHPYPRWLSMHRPDGDPGQEPRRLLVAGCGTGPDAIAAALRHPSWVVDAIDISRRSLGYAMRKALELGVTNIAFRLTDLRNAGGTYEVIHAYGVLHHLADPVEGLRALRHRLDQHGELLLGVYSRRGRASLNRLRELGGPLDGASRGRIFAALNEEERAALEDLDFFERGHFLDTLYHPHEVELGPVELETLIRSAGFVFAGFESLPGDVAATYGNELDLRVWDAIEAARPDLFRSMFRCRLRCA